MSINNSTRESSTESDPGSYSPHRTRLFEILYAQSLPAVDQLADRLWQRSYPGCSPEDLVSETYFKAWRGFDGFDQNAVANPTSWFLKILTNVYRDALKKDSRLDVVDLSEDTAHFADPIKYVDLLRACAELKPIDQALIYEHYWEGYKFAELAKIHSMNDTHPRLRTDRARKLLERKLTGQAA